MRSRLPVGGIIHTYQKYDPKSIPGPTEPPPDLLSGAFNHLMAYGSLRELTDEELAKAVHIDPNQIAGLGPSLQSLMEMLRERKRKILATYETDRVKAEAAGRYRQWGTSMTPAPELRKRFERAFLEEQIHDLERLWYFTNDERGQFARQLVQLVNRLGDKYQIDELASKYEFTGRTEMSIPKALEVKEELETIDRLLKQLEEAAKTAKIGVIDLNELAEFAEPGDVEQLRKLAEQIEEYIRQMAERQGLEKTAHGYQLAPKAYRLFQGRLLEHIFSNLEAARVGRHQGPILGEGAVEMQKTKPYEFGDSLSNMDIPGTFVNAMVRNGPGLPVRIGQEDIEIHHTRNTPKCASVVLLDMSGSMRYDGLYIDVKRMGLALEGLIRREYPGDYLQFVELFSFAKPRHVGEIAALLPKPVTIYDPVVQLRADMSDEKISEFDIPPHFTNIQHGLHMARRFLARKTRPTGGSF